MTTELPYIDENFKEQSSTYNADMTNMLKAIQVFIDQRTDASTIALMKTAENKMHLSFHDNERRYLLTIEEILD